MSFTLVLLLAVISDIFVSVFLIEIELDDLSFKSSSFISSIGEYLLSL